MSSFNNIAFSLKYSNKALVAVDFPQPIFPLKTLIILHRDRLG